VGRHRGYEEHTVLADVMQAFRRRGYGAVSIRDIESATSVSAGSLYHAYGGKDALFDAAVRHYNDTVVMGRIERHAPAGSGVDGLRELFRSLLHEPDGARHGCLLTNTAVERGAAQPHPRVTEGLALLEHCFRDRLAETAREPRWVTLTALRLLALYQGVLVLVRSGHDLSIVDQMVIAEFDELKRGN
jgi:AcrR family transcriptional regulator